MKKSMYILIALTLSALVFLYGCGNDNEETTAAETETQVVSQTEPIAESETSATVVTSYDNGGMSYSESGDEDEANFNDLFG